MGPDFLSRLRSRTMDEIHRLRVEDYEDNGATQKLIDKKENSKAHLGLELNKIGASRPFTKL